MEESQQSKWPTAAGPALFVGLAFLAWAAARAAPIALHHHMLGGNDVRIYMTYARQWWSSGRVPYRDFRVEYPPGGLLVFLLPYLVESDRKYSLAFGFEMVVCDLVCYAIILDWARALHANSRGRVALAGGLYLVATGTLISVLYERYDLASSTLALGALYLAYRVRRTGWSAVALGLAGAVKLWPLALAPLWLLLGWRRDRWRGLSRVCVGLLMGLLVPSLPFLSNAGLHIFDFLGYHLERGLQIESTWAPWVFFAGQARDSMRAIVFAHGALELHGALASTFVAVSTPVLVTLVLAPQLLGFRRESGANVDVCGKQGLLIASAVILGFMIGGKVLSPQFLLWVIPPLALSAEGPLMSVALLVTAGLTTAVFPALYDPLQHEFAPLRPLAVGCLAARNFMLMVLYVALLVELWRRTAASEVPAISPAAPAPLQPTHP